MAFVPRVSQDTCGRDAVHLLMTVMCRSVEG